MKRELGLIFGLKGEDLMRMMATLQIQDPTIQKILPNYQDAVAQEANLLNSGLGENHPKVKALRATRQVFTKQLEEQGISAEVIDPRTLVPLDEDTILRSVAKTGRAVVVDEGRDRASAASHIAAILADKGFATLKAPVKRVTVPNVAMPYAPNAEARVFPGEEQIASAALSITRVAA